MSQSLKRNYIYNLLLQLSKVVFPFITAPYIARVLDPDGVGVCNFVNTYVGYFALFAALGVPTYGIRETAKLQGDRKKSELLISQLLSIELIATICATLLYVITLLFIPQLKEDLLLFIWAGILLYVTPFKIEWFFSGREEFGFITFRSLVIKTLSVLLLFILVRTKEDLLNYILLGTFAGVANELWNYVKLFKLGIHPYITFQGLKRHLKPVYILFASSAAISIYVMLDTLMLGFQSNYTEVGFYNSAMHLVKCLLPVATSLSAVAIPRVSSYMAGSQTDRITELMNKSLGTVSLLAFPMTVGIILVAPTFVPLFFGVEFNGAILPLQISSFLIVAIGLNNLNGIQILTAMGKDKQFFCSVLSGAVMNFILNLILIPRYGAVGAAISSVYAETQILIMNEYFVRKHTDIKVTNYKDLLKSLLGALCFVPWAYLCNLYLEGWVYVIVCCISCALIYMLTQKLLSNATYLFMVKTMLSKIGIHK